MVNYTINVKYISKNQVESFPFVPPQLSVCILFAPPDARAIFLQNDLLYNDTCSVSGGAYRTRGWGTNGKDPSNLYNISFKCL